MAACGCGRAPGEAIGSGKKSEAIGGGNKRHAGGTWWGSQHRRSGRIGRALRAWEKQGDRRCPRGRVSRQTALFARWGPLACAIEVRTLCACTPNTYGPERGGGDGLT